MAKSAGMRLIYQSILVLMLVAIIVSPAVAVNYTISTMDAPGYPDTQLYGINDAGKISGTCGTIDFSSQFWQTSHGCWAVGGQFGTFDVPGATGATQGQGIDAQGRIVGYYLSTSFHGFLFANSTFTYPLDATNSTNTYATAINSQTQIVGYYVGNSGVQGFLYDGGIYTPLSVPASDATYALGINDAGEILGYYRISGVIHGFIRSNGSNGPVYTTVDVPGADGTILYGKNSANHIVGTYSKGGTIYGFVYDGKTFHTIQPSGAVSCFARGINNLGQIVGTYQDQNNKWHGFIAQIQGNLAPIYLLLLD